MSKLKILSSALAELHTVDGVINCSKQESINSDNVLSFEMYLTADNKGWINDTNVIGIDSDYYDIARYRAGANQKGDLTVNVDCEHISYRLNNPDFDEDYFAATGTPTEILIAILSGTGFTVGSVEFSGTHTYSAQEKMSRRAILVQFAEYLGGELSFNGFNVSILAQRGTTYNDDYEYYPSFTNNTIVLCNQQPVIVNGRYVTQGDTSPLTAPVNSTHALLVMQGYKYIVDAQHSNKYFLTTSSAVFEYAAKLTLYIATERYTYKNLTADRNITVISKDVDKTQRDELGNPIVAYECELIEPIALSLGDTVAMAYDTLGINISLRIVSITTNPYNSAEVSFSVSNTVPTIEDEAYEIKTSTVGKDKLYNGCRIGPEYGFENLRSDGKTWSYFKSDDLAFKTKDGEGWKTRLSFVYDEGADEYNLVYNGGFSVTTTALLADQWGAADALILTSAETYAAGVGAAIELSVAATYETQSAAAQLLVDSKTYADSAVSTLSATVSSTYETKTAAAQLLLDAKSYADSGISSASATLSASIGDVSAALSLYAGYVDDTYQSQATLSADVVSILSSDFKIIGSGGTATIIDADMYANNLLSFSDYSASYTANGYHGYYGELVRLKSGNLEFWDINTNGSGDGYGLMYVNSAGTALSLESVTGIDLDIFSGSELKLGSTNGIILDSSILKTSLSGVTPTLNRLVLLKV